MNLSALARTPSPTAAPNLKTETGRAQAFAGNTTRDTLPANVLDVRVGTGSVAGGLNDQVRFRVEGSGPHSQRNFVPDNQLTAALAGSDAGPRLLRMLKVAAASADSLPDKTQLHGFILAEDTQSVAAGMVLADFEHADAGTRKLENAAGRDSKRANELAQHYYADAKDGAKGAGAWNDDGWITYFPDTARAMLVQSGAYTPHKGEKKLLDPAKRATYMVGNQPHEVQHSVTLPGALYERANGKWVEEGTANVFSRTPNVHARNAKAMGVSARSYAAQLRAPDDFQTGWGEWQRPKLTPKEEKDQQQNVGRNYTRSHELLLDFLKLGGAPMTTKAGERRAFELLQGKHMIFAAGNLADAIIDQQQLDPKVREKLRLRIRDSVDFEGDPVAAIRRDFGIG